MSFARVEAAAALPNPKIRSQPSSYTFKYTRIPVTQAPSTPKCEQDISCVRSGFELFLISTLILLLELAAIRWFPAHVLYLTFFTNIVLLACFLGMSVGCLAANHRRNYLKWTPLLLTIALVGALFVEITSGSFVKFD